MSGDKLLFTPGPLLTSPTVKQAMLRDLGARDGAFIDLVREIRQRLLQLAGVGGGTYEAVLMQGSGTFGVESVLSSIVPRGGKLLVAVNGAYGRRMAEIASALAIEVETIVSPERLPIVPQQVAEALARDPAITHVGMIHCETTTGILNPVEEVGGLVRERRRTFLVDAMSSFGGMPLDLRAWGIDFLISSANKCLEGVPGISFVLARRDLLAEADGRARSVSLDLVSQWKGLESNGQFRFTPPTHVLLAFSRALMELETEGGITARASRYAENRRILLDGMMELGFEPYLAPPYQSHIITTFRHLSHPKFTFTGLYQRLSDKGFVIYPGKLTDCDCFRIGTIGHIFPRDVRSLLVAVRSSLEEMGVAQAKALPGARVAGTAEQGSA